MDVVKSFVLYRYILPYDPPFPEREGLLLRIFHPEGEGWGEIAPLPGRSRETLSQALEQLLYVLTEEKSISLFPSVAFGLFSAQQHTQSLKSPLPLSALLAGTPEQIIAKAEKASSQGYTSAKIKITGIPLSIAKELIQHVGRQFNLRIDANRAFSFQEAMRLCEECGLHGIEYVEEPTYELDQLEHFNYPFALDESLIEMNTLPKNSYFKAIVWKPSVMGIECAKEKKLILSSACETGIGILGIASLAATFKDIQPLGLDTYRFLPQDILSTPLDFSSGYIHPPASIHVNTKMLQEIAHG